MFGERTQFWASWWATPSTGSLTKHPSVSVSRSWKQESSVIIFKAIFFVPKFQYILLDKLFSSQLFSRPSHTIHPLSSGYFQIVSLAWFFVELLVVSEASDICSVDHGEPWTLYTFKRRPTGTHFLRIWPSVSLISLFWSWRAWIISRLLRVELL